jgi:hypothetical protein
LLVAVAGGLLGQGAYYPSVQRPVGLLIAVATLLGMVGRPLTRDDLRLLPVVPALALAAWAVLDGARVGVAGGSVGQALLLVGLVAVLVVCRRLGQEDRDRPAGGPDRLAGGRRPGRLLGVPGPGVVACLLDLDLPQCDSSCAGGHQLGGARAAGHDARFGALAVAAAGLLTGVAATMSRAGALALVV